jgi:hypothetical protein
MEDCAHMNSAFMLALLQKYRKEDPSNSEETEFVENLFDILCVVLHDHPTNQKLFAEHDGIQLMLTMIKRYTYAKNAAFKALDYEQVALFGKLCGLLTLSTTAVLSAQILLPAARHWLIWVV